MAANYPIDLETRQMDTQGNEAFRLNQEEIAAFLALAERRGGLLEQKFELIDRVNAEFYPAVSEMVIEDGFNLDGNQLISPDSLTPATGTFGDPLDGGVGVVERIVPNIRLSPAGPIEFDFVSTSTDLDEGVFGAPGQVDRINRNTVMRSRIDGSWANSRRSISGANMGHSVKLTPNNWTEVFYRFRPEIHIEANGLDVANGYDASLLLNIYASIEYFDPANGNSAGFLHPANGYQFKLGSLAGLLTPGATSINGFLTMPSQLSEGAIAFLIAGRKYLSSLNCALVLQTTKPGNRQFNISADAKVSLL